MSSQEYIASQSAPLSKSQRRKLRRQRKIAGNKNAGTSVIKGPGTNQSDLSRSGINNYITKFIMNDNVPTPRPIPSPTSVFTVTRTINFKAPTGDPLNLVVIAQPDVYDPYLYYNPHGVTSTTSVVLEFVKSGTLLLQGESYASGSRDIHLMFSLVPNNPAIQRVQPVFKVASLSSICIAPDYRDYETLLIEDGGIPYYNFAAATALSTVSVTYVVRGSAYATVTANLLEYDNVNLTGTLTVAPMTVIANNANQFTISLSAHTFALNTRSITFQLIGMAKIDSVTIDAGFNISSFHLDNYESGILSPVNPSDEASWNATLQVSDAWAVTGMHVTVSNTTAQSFTGGQVGMALVPISYVIPSDFTDCLNFISSRRHYKYIGPVITGAHGMWSPRDLRETLHQPIYGRLYSNRIVAAVNIPASGAAAASVQVKFSMRIELLTNSQTVASYLPPSSAVALDDLFASIRYHLNDAYGENPDHIQRLKDIAKRVAQNPALINSLKNLGKAGLAALSSALIL